MKRWLTILLNLVAYDVCWTVAMFGAGRPWWWAGPVVITLSTVGQLLLGPNAARLGAVILAGSTVGVLGDLLASRIGLFTFNGDQSQFVLVFLALWVNFGTTLTPTLRFLWRRPFAAALLGAIGGPAAYWLGDRIGTIALADSGVAALVWCSMQYATIIPLWMLIAARCLPAEAAPVSEPGAKR
ncbi:MAG: DUF2878 domain-containing protein [Phycisphaerales bacterium JB041]